MPKSIFFKTILVVSLAVSFFAISHFSLADGSGIFLTLHTENKTKDSDMMLKGRVGEGASVSVLVNGENVGAVGLNEQNRYHVRIPLALGNNTVRVIASRGGIQEVIEKSIQRKARLANEKSLWISIIHSKNQTKKSDVLIKGKAYGVSGVEISVDGVYQKTVSPNEKSGKFRTRVNINPGWNEIQAEISGGAENVTATKMVKRI